MKSNMKPIQVLFDESLLQALDADEEVKRRGRSAVLRRAAAEYLRQSRARRIAARYRKAYGGDVPVAEEFEGWESEGMWPEE
jgi:metal-responsive CopG/Arc/MetJ family transcriptional regulator